MDKYRPHVLLQWKRYSSRNHSPAYSAARAFTLLEILASIAVIVILFAIVFSVHSQVRSSMNRTKSVSNIRQLNYAILLYATDHNNTLPPVSGTSSGSSPWMEVILPYLQENIRHWGPIAAYNGIVPQNRQYPELFYAPQLAAGVSHPWGDYGLNRNIFHQSGIGIPLSLIPDNQKIATLLECGAWQGAWGPSFSHLLTDDHLAVAYVDGHVESALKTDIQERPSRFYGKLIILSD